MNNEEIICRDVAKYFEDRDWYKLTNLGRKIVGDLEQAGWLQIKEKADGFIGKANQGDSK